MREQRKDKEWPKRICGSARGKDLITKAEMVFL